MTGPSARGAATSGEALGDQESGHPPIEPGS
jgi:hypothetical protein